MTRLLALLLVLFPVAAPAADDAIQDLDAPEERTRKVVVPPLRLDTRVVIREHANPGPLIEGQVQVTRTEKVAVDVGVSYTAHHGLGVVGPLRTMGSLDGLVDVRYEIGPWLATGPSAGVGLRFYRQQWTPIEEVWTPTVGWRIDGFLIRARRWGLMISTKVSVDLRRTDLVLATAQIDTLSPVEGQFGLRWAFGHGRPK